MKVKVRSAYDDSDLEREINRVVAQAEDNDFYLSDVKYSVTYDENEQEVLRSAVLMFEEYEYEDDEEEEFEDED